MAAKRKIKTEEGEVTPEVAEALGESAVAVADVAPAWYTRDLAMGFSVSGEDVRALRGILGLPTGDDRFEPDLEAAVRRFQSANGILPDGKVTEDLAKLLGEA